MVVPSVKVIVLLFTLIALLKFDIPRTVKEEPSNVFNEYKLGVVIDDGVMIVEFELEFVVIDDGVIVVEVSVPSVKVNELQTTEPEEEPEMLFEFITF